MSLFNWKKNLSISEKEPTYKVRYLGNVQTAMMKGEGCVDKPVNIIWNNHTRSSHSGLEMKLTITSTGLTAWTKEQGITEYRAHRITYCIAHPKYPKLFIWVYRHEGKKMKVELRCHAVLCKTEAKAKALAVQLHDKLKFVLKEFCREKTRKQNSRLVLQRTNSLPQSGEVLPKRTQILSTGKKFKPPISKSNTAPKLSDIWEDPIDEELAEIDEEEDLEPPQSPTVEALDLPMNSGAHSIDIDSLNSRVIDLEIGNNIEELKLSSDVQYCLNHGDSDEESSESGFHEQDQEGIKEVVNSTDSTSLEGEVCESPSGEVLQEHSEMTCL